MKKKRQQAIRELVQSKDIDTQESLKAELEELGFKVTQATVSRDISELGLIKTVSDDGRHKYSIARSTAPKLSPLEELYSLMRSLAVSLDYAGNTVVIRCHTGMAQAVCAKLDAAKLEQVVGTLAGDDTIFVLVRTQEEAAKLVGILRDEAGV